MISDIRSLILLVLPSIWFICCYYTWIETKTLKSLRFISYSTISAKLRCKTYFILSIPKMRRHLINHVTLSSKFSNSMRAPVRFKQETLEMKPNFRKRSAVNTTASNVENTTRNLTSNWRSILNNSSREIISCRQTFNGSHFAFLLSVSRARCKLFLKNHRSSRPLKCETSRRLSLLRTKRTMYQHCQSDSLQSSTV